MLNHEAALSLVSLLSNDSDPLSVIASQFSFSLDTRTRMTALTGLSMLLVDLLLDHAQQIVATWLLFNEFQTIPLSDNPFLPVFAFLFELRFTSPNACSPQLYDILACILGAAQPDKLGEFSVGAIFGPAFAFSAPKIASPAAPKGCAARVSPVLVERVENAGEQLAQPAVLAELLADAALYEDFDPGFVRPPPAVSPLFQGELAETFVAAFANRKFLFDEN
jgi:hypothetical protein